MRRRSPNDVRVAEAAQGGEPAAAHRHGRGQGGGRSGGLARRPRRPIDFVAREEFDYTCKEVADGPAARRHRGLELPGAPTGSCSTIRPRPMIEDMDALPWVAPVYQRDLNDRELLHRLPEASLRVALHRPRLPLQVHVLPVAADRRRPPLPGAQRRRTCIDEVRWIKEQHAAGEGDLLRRRHFHRLSAARRGDRPRHGQARRDLVVQRQGERAVSRRSR